MGPKKKKDPIYIDGVNTTVLSREQLEKFALTLKETLDREREERNFFQLERDKIRTFWDITKQQLEDCRAELLNKERELEEKEDSHQDESKHFKQKVKHLVYEHHKNIADLRADGMLSLKMTQEDFNEQELALLTDKKNLKESLIEQQKQHQEEIRNLSMKFTEELSHTRSDFETEVRDIEAKYEDKVLTLRSELALRHSMEISEVDERKNKQISDLMINHEKAFTEMKNYYNDLILNNLTLISNLKEQMEEMKSREDRIEKSLKECQRENRNLVEPMKQALAENKELKRQLVNYSKDKIALTEARRRVGELEKTLDDYKWEKEALELRFIKSENLRKDMQDTFFSSMLDAQEKCVAKNILLEKKLKHLLKLLELRETMFAEFLKSHKFDHAKLTQVNIRIDKVLAKKNAALEDLEYDLARVCKAHDDVVNTFQGKLEQYGIPREELGFVPLRTATLVAKGPAGLVSVTKLLPCGIVPPPHIMPPLGTATQPEETEDKLFSASQRFTYFQDKQPPGNGRFPLKRNIRPPARFKNARMTVRLRPRQVLCSKCRGICNENSENVDFSARKKKGADSLPPDAPPAKLSRGDRRLRSAGEISPRPIFPDNYREQPKNKNNHSDYSDGKNKKLCSSLIPTLSRLQPNEISNAMNGKVKIKIVGNYWIKNGPETENDGKSDNLTIFGETKNNEASEDQDPLSIPVTDTSNEKPLTEPKFVATEYSLDVNPIEKLSEPIVPMDIVKPDHGLEVEGGEEQDPLSTEDPLAILHEDGELCDADSTTSVRRVLRKKRSVGSMEDLWDETIFEEKFSDKKGGNLKSRTTPIIKISFGSGTGEGTVLKIPAKVQSYIPTENVEEDKKKEKTKRDASAKAAKKALKKAKKEARRKVLGGTSPVRSLGGASPRYPNLSPRYAISCSSPRYTLGGNNSPRHTLVGNSSPAYEVLHTRRHKHKVKHKKRHKEDRKHKEIEGEAPASSVAEGKEDENIREQCLKQKLSISLKRLNANAYMRCDSSSSGSKSPSNSDASDDHSDTVPDFPGNPLMMRISSQTISSCQTSDGRLMAVGDVVWGKIHGFPWWPGKVLSITKSLKDDGACTSPQAHVAWYGSSTSSLMSCDQLNPFLETFQIRYNKKKRGPYKEAIRQATTEAKRGEGIISPDLYSSPSEVDVVS